MRVLFLSHSSGPRNLGGAELTLLHLIDRWRSLRPDVEVHVVARTPIGLLQTELESRGVGHDAIDFGSWVLPLEDQEPQLELLNARMDSRAVLWLVDKLREFAPDVVVTNTIVSPWAALAAKYLRLPHVWLVHEFGDLDHRLGFQIGRDETFEDIGVLSELVVANSEAVRDHVAQWIPSDKLTIAYPAIDLDRVRSGGNAEAVAAEDPGIPGALSAVMVGRITASKGPWRLVRAVAKLRDEGVPITATLIGPADELDKRDLETLVDELGVRDRVFMVGEQRNPFPLVAQADLAVMGSDHEAFGRVTVEYQSLGKPVVATRSGANPELIRDGQTGWLFDPSNLEELVTALRAAQSDLDEVGRRGKAARRFVEDELADTYPIDALVERIEDVASAGARGVPRLPNVTRLWLSLPLIVEKRFGEISEIPAVAFASPTWKVGRAVMAPVTLLRRVLRRADWPA